MTTMLRWRGCWTTGRRTRAQLLQSPSTSRRRQLVLQGWCLRRSWGAVGFVVTCACRIDDAAILQELGGSEPLLAESTQTAAQRAAADAAGGGTEPAPEAVGDGVDTSHRGAAEVVLVRAGAQGGVPGTGIKAGTVLLETSVVGPLRSLALCRLVGTMAPVRCSGNNVAVRVLNPNTGCVRTVEFNLDSMRLVSALYGEGLSSFDVVVKLTTAAESAIASHAARRALLALLLVWPPSVRFGLAAVGGAVDFVSLARVVAASESVFSSSRGVGAGSSSPLMGVVSRKLLELLALEHSGVADVSVGPAAGVLPLPMCLYRVCVSAVHARSCLC